MKLKTNWAVHTTNGKWTNRHLRYSFREKCIANDFFNSILNISMRSFVEKLFGKDVPPTFTTKFNATTSMPITM